MIIIKLYKMKIRSVDIYIFLSKTYLWSTIRSLTTNMYISTFSEVPYSSSIISKSFQQTEYLLSNILEIALNAASFAANLPA